jgi:glutamate racemase
MPLDGDMQKTPQPLPPPAAAPVGIFDSGLGGLSILRDIAALLPGEPLLYIADSLHAPYGEKPAAFVVERSVAICDWLVDEGAKALVVACNTATAHAVGPLRQRYPRLPVIGVEPGLKPAAGASASKIVGVLATENTLNSEKFRQLLNTVQPHGTYVCRAGHGLVPLIEAGEIDGAQIEGLLRGYLLPMFEAGTDTLVLGCTHYPFLAPVIERIAREEKITLRLIDTGEAVARQLARKLGEQALLAGAHESPRRFCSTWNADHLREMVARLLCLEVTAESVRIA